MNQPPVDKDTRTVAETPAPAENRPAGEDQTRTAVLGPFGLRDLVVGGSVLLMLIGSLLPWNVAFDLQLTLWSPLTPLFFLGIGIILPLLVAGLFAARRMAPELKYRIGSLSVDQFGSVVGVLAMAFFFLQLVTEFTIGTLLTFIGALGLVAATTLAPHIPPFSREFDERAEMPAHVMARDAVRLRRRPAAPAAPAVPAAPAQTSGSGEAGYTDVEATSAESRPTESRPAGSRFAGIGTKLAPTGLFGRKSGAGTPAPNGIPEGSETVDGAPAGATALSRGDAVSSETASSETVGDDTAGAEPARSGSAAAQGAPAANAAAAAPAPRRDDAIAATTVNPVVPAQQSRAASTDTSQSEAKRFEAEPATQASPLVSPSSSGSDSISATREESENVVEAFWFAVGTPRQIVDERTGLPLFMFHPGDWELGLEDRGNEFLVQDKRTGRIGVLRDLSNIERVGEDSGE